MSVVYIFQIFFVFCPYFMDSVPSLTTSKIFKFLFKLLYYL